MKKESFLRSFFVFHARYRHFHFVYFLHYIRKYLFVTLLPLVQALIAWDIETLLTALRQSGVLLAAVSLVAALFWQASGWYLDDTGVLHIRSGVIFRRHLLIRGSELSAVRTDRALLLRPLGAGMLTLYYARIKRPGTVKLYLTKADCTFLADALMPVDAPPFYKPVGAERLSLMLLSVNVAATAFVLYAAVRQTQGLGIWAEELALSGVNSAVRGVATFLPMGVAWCVAVLGILLGISVLRSFFHTARYRVCKTGQCVLSCGGLLHLSECRVRLSAVTACDIRATPTARLMRRLPVYLIAGAYTGGELPVLLYRPGRDAALRSLLPGVALPDNAKCETAGRSLVAFLLPGGIASGAALLFLILSLRILPNLAPAFFVALLASLALLAVGFDGRRKEGLFVSGGHFTARVVTRYTLHTYCFFGSGLYASFHQNPWSFSVRRGNAVLHLPAGAKLTVKNIQEQQAAAAFRRNL